jgi:hypothetical protein
MTIKEQEYAVPDGYTSAQLMPYLLDELGSLDPELRDHTVYMILSRRIMNQQFGLGEMRTILKRCVFNLKVGLGEEEGDHVFLRSFSLLVLDALLYTEN